MKKHVLFLIYLCVMLYVSFPINAFNYYPSFTGSGASTSVDSVIVQNLSKSTQIKVPAGTQLRLYYTETSIISLNTIADLACVFPNPMIDNATFSFVAKNDGIAQISIFNLDGRKVFGLEMFLLQGKQSFQLVLPKGVFIVQAKGNGYSYTSKTICLSMADCQPMISFNNGVKSNKPQKVEAPEVKLQYSPNDQILYKGYSGNYCTIVTDRPTQSNTIDFKFVDCTDADGNHYAVVHIGTQTWMAENLKTTKYRNGQDINSNTIFYPAYTFVYGNDVNNAAKYGRLYNWFSATDSRNIAPVGWHLSSHVEWTTLKDHLIANGYNYDGTTADNKIAKSLASSNLWEIFTTVGSIGNDLTKNNSTGFSAIPAGVRHDGGPYGGINNVGYWWSSQMYSGMQAWYWSLYYNTSDLVAGHTPNELAFSVRCVKD